MVRMEELLAIHAPSVLAHVKRAGHFDLSATEKILDYTVNVADNEVVQHLNLCTELEEHATMNNDAWDERCYNQHTQSRRRVAVRAR